MSRKYLNLILISIGFSIWIAIFYNLVFVEDQEESSPLSAGVTQSKRNIDRKIAELNYPDSKLRDPFITPFNYSAAKPKPVKTIKQQPPPPIKNVPNLRLLGIINDQAGALAIIRFPDNSIQFIRKNQQVGEVEIIEIGEYTVKFKFEKEIHSINLN